MRMANAKIMKHRRRHLDPAPVPEPVEVGEREQLHAVHRLGQEQAGEQQADGQAEREGRPGPEPERRREVGVADRGVRVDGGGHERRRDERDAQAAAGDEVVGAVAVDLAGDDDADEDDGEDGETDSGDDHGGSEGTADGSGGFDEPAGRSFCRPTGSLTTRPVSGPMRARNACVKSATAALAYARARPRLRPDGVVRQPRRAAGASGVRPRARPGARGRARSRRACSRPAAAPRRPPRPARRRRRGPGCPGGAGSPTRRARGPARRGRRHRRRPPSRARCTGPAGATRSAWNSANCSPATSGST